MQSFPRQIRFYPQKKKITPCSNVWFFPSLFGGGSLWLRRVFFVRKSAYLRSAGTHTYTRVFAEARAITRRERGFFVFARKDARAFGEWFSSAAASEIKYKYNTPVTILPVWALLIPNSLFKYSFTGQRVCFRYGQLVLIENIIFPVDCFGNSFLIIISSSTSLYAKIFTYLWCLIINLQ